MNIRLVWFSPFHGHLYVYNPTDENWQSLKCHKIPPGMFDELPLPRFSRQPGNHWRGKLSFEDTLRAEDISERRRHSKEAELWKRALVGSAKC